LPEEIEGVLVSNMLRVPPLRRRKEDIPDIVNQHLFFSAQDRGGEIKGVSSEFLDALADYDWPGNDMELAQVLDRASKLSGRQPMLLIEHLPEALGGAAEMSTKTLPSYREYRDSALSGVEKAYLLDVIEHSRGDHKIAENITGLSRSRMYELLSKYDLTFKSVARKNRRR
jgi:two-component system NtrC family response regulator